MESSGDHSSSLFIPGPFYLLESVCIYPGFENIFVLLVDGVFGMSVLLGEQLYKLQGLFYGIGSDE